MSAWSSSYGKEAVMPQHPLTEACFNNQYTNYSIFVKSYKTEWHSNSSLKLLVDLGRLYQGWCVLLENHVSEMAAVAVIESYEYLLFLYLWLD